MATPALARAYWPRLERAKLDHCLVLSAPNRALRAAWVAWCATQAYHPVVIQRGRGKYTRHLHYLLDTVRGADGRFYTARPELAHLALAALCQVLAAPVPIDAFPMGRADAIRLGMIVYGPCFADRADWVIADIEPASLEAVRAALWRLVSNPASYKPVWPEPVEEDV